MASAQVLLFLALALALAAFSSPAIADDGSLCKAFGVLENEQRFTRFLSLINSTDLFPELMKLDEATIFVPNDQAFALASRLSEHKMEKVLKYHIVPKYYSYDSLIGNVQFPLSTLASGNQSAFQIRDINGGLITSGANYAEMTGVVVFEGLVAAYEIDRVLMPMELYHYGSCGDEVLASLESPPPSSPLAVEHHDGGSSSLSVLSGFLAPLLLLAIF